MRSVAANIIRAAAHATGFSRRRARASKQLCIFFVHNVGDDAYSVEVFRAQMAYLKEHFEVVSLREITARLARGGPDGRGAIALTFDDGLRKHHDVVYPILRDLGLPATYYICPGLIERGEWLWTHDLRARLLCCSKPRRDALFRSFDMPGEDVSRALIWMKTLPRERLTRIANAIIDETRGFVPTKAQRDAYDLMTWDEVLSLDPDLITIGSHTVNHVVLPAQSAAQIALEIVESKRLLEQKTGRPIEHFCYPDGQWNDLAMEVTKRTYASAVTVEDAFIRRGESVHRLPRISMPKSLSALSWRLHWSGGIGRGRAAAT